MPEARHEANPHMGWDVHKRNYELLVQGAHPFEAGLFLARILLQAQPFEGRSLDYLIREERAGISISRFPPEYTPPSLTGWSELEEFSQTFVVGPALRAYNRMRIIKVASQGRECVQAWVPEENPKKLRLYVYGQ